MLEQSGEIIKTVSPPEAIPSILKELHVPLKGEGVIKIPNRKYGLVTVNYGCRAFFRQPEFYLHQHSDNPE